MKPNKNRGFKNAAIGNRHVKGQMSLRQRKRFLSRLHIRHCHMVSGRTGATTGLCETWATQAKHEGRLQTAPDCRLQQARAALHGEATKVKHPFSLASNYSLRLLVSGGWQMGNLEKNSKEQSTNWNGSRRTGTSNEDNARGCSFVQQEKAELPSQAALSNVAPPLSTSGPCGSNALQR